MNQQTILELGRDALMVTALISGPLLLVGTVVGLLVSILQTITSVHEQTLTFVVKMGAMLVAGALLLPWMLRTLCQYTAALLTNLGCWAL